MSYGSTGPHAGSDAPTGVGRRRSLRPVRSTCQIEASPDRVTTVSYGKERPVALGSDEQSWARNRRAVTIVLN